MTALAQAPQAMIARDRATGPLPAPFSGSPVQPLAFYPAGGEVYAQGDRSGTLYHVEFGAVRVYRLLCDGRRQISAFHLAGEVFGFESGTERHFFAEAIGATALRAMRPVTCASLSHDLLPLALQELVRAQEHLLVLGRQNATERVAAFLVDMAERQGGLEQFELPMSRTDIGDYLGLTIETVSRAFSKLKERGVIRLPSLRGVEILKWQVLCSLSE